MFTADCNNVFLSLFNSSVFKIIKERLESSHNNSLPVTFKLREYFTPPSCERDKIVYACVREAQSATKHDVYGYLNDLKADLDVAQENTPLIVLCGDQQTYSIIRFT